jgi:hypothetical protein
MSCRPAVVHVPEYGAFSIWALWPCHGLYRHEGSCSRRRIILSIKGRRRKYISRPRYQSVIFGCWMHHGTHRRQSTSNTPTPANNLLPLKMPPLASLHYPLLSHNPLRLPPQLQSMADPCHQKLKVPVVQCPPQALGQRTQRGATRLL